MVQVLDYGRGFDGPGGWQTWLSLSQAATCWLSQWSN